MKVEQGDADKKNASDSSSSSSSSGENSAGSSSDSDDPPGDTKAAAPAKEPAPNKPAPSDTEAAASPIAIRPVQGKACAKMMVRSEYRCRCHFQRSCPNTNGRPLSGM